MSNVPSNATITHLTEHVILNTAPTVDPDGACHIEANGDDHIHLDSRTKHVRGTIIPNLFDDAGNTLLTTGTNSVQYAATATVDFNNADLTNAVFTDDTSFASGTTVDFNNATIANFTLGAGVLSASAVASANGYASLDAELDTVTATQNTVKARTENLTAGRMMKASGAGILVVSDVPETDVGRLSTAQTFTGSKKFGTTVRVDVAGDETGLHLAGNHDNTNNHGGKLRLTKFEADKTTGKFSTVMYQDGATQQGDTVLVSGCTVSSATRGFKFQAFKTSPNFDNIIAGGDVDTLGYITRNGINCTSGEYLKNGSQITYTDLAGTIATAQVGDTQITDGKIAGMAASKLTGTVTNAQIDTMAASKLTGVLSLQNGEHHLRSTHDTAALTVSSASATANNTGGEIHFVKYAADGTTAEHVGGISQSGRGNLNLTAGTQETATNRGIQFNATQDEDVFDGALDVLGYITRSGFNCTSGEYLKNGSQITYTDLAGTIATAQIGDTQVTDGKIAAVAASKLTGTVTNAQIDTMATSKLTGTVTNAQIDTMATSKLTGTVTNAQIDTMAASKLTGTVSDAQIASMSADKLTGSIEVGNLANAVQMTGTQSVAGAKTFTTAGCRFNAGLSVTGGEFNVAAGGSVGVDGAFRIGTASYSGAKRALKVGAGNIVEFEDVQIEQDSGFAKIKVGQRLLADNATITGGIKLAEDTPTGAGLNLQNGLPTGSYDTTNKAQVMFGYNGGGTFPHYIKSSHQSDTSAAAQDAGSKLDFLINDGEADVASATAIEAHAPKVLSISSQSVRCHKELRPDAGILMPFGTLGYNLVHQILPHSVIGTSHQLFVRFHAQPASSSTAAGQEHKTLQPHKGSYSAFVTITDGTFSGAVNATDTDDKTNSGGSSVSISYGHADVADGSHFVSSFAGYIYWGTGWASEVIAADNRLVRVSVAATEGCNLYCDGKLVIAQAKDFSNSITGAGTNTRYYTFTARGAYTALEGHCTTDDTNMVFNLSFQCFSYWDN